MTSNLPQTQKTDWVNNDMVKPADTNEWGGAINTLSNVLPLYAVTGDYYTVTSFSSNTFNLSPVTFQDSTQNQCITSYVDGMRVRFKSTASTSGSTSVNVNNIGVKTIYTPAGTVLSENSIMAGDLIELLYNLSQDCFYLINYVSCTGDTMTGTLEFDKSMSSTNASDSLCIKSQFNHIVDANNLPSSKLYAGRILVADNAEINKVVYTEHSRLNTNGDVARFFDVYNYDANGDQHYAELALFVDVNGNAYFRFPRCTTKPTTVSTAGQNSVCVVVENYVNGSSWYRKWSDGFIEQGGTNTLTGNSSTQILLLKSFSNTNYTVAGLHSFSVTGSQKNAYLYSKAKGSFNVYLYGATSGDPALNWYACGY